LHRSVSLEDFLESGKPASETYEQDEMKFVLPSLWMTKIFNDFYGSAVFKATKFFLMTKLEFGKQLVMDRTTKPMYQNIRKNFEFQCKL